MDAPLARWLTAQHQTSAAYLEGRCLTHAIVNLAATAAAVKLFLLPHQLIACYLLSEQFDHQEGSRTDGYAGISGHPHPARRTSLFPF